MKKYICTICNYIYDEAAGIPDKGIPPGTKWEDLPEDWTCPLCGATKAEFKEQTYEEKKVAKSMDVQETYKEDMRELSFGELSALCSNLSKGCEKQYRMEESGLFAELAEYYDTKSEPVEGIGFEGLAELINKDLESYENANNIPGMGNDRGALRALVWGEKVTRILSSLLNRYESNKDELLENTNIYVCEICGFIYIGDEAPEICPVCKVPKMKIRKIERKVV